MDTKLVDLIKVYPSVLPLGLCRELIESYERTTTRVSHSRSVSQYEQVWMRPEPELHALQPIVHEHVSICVQDYMLDTWNVALFPSKYDYEPYKIKKYNDGDYFNRHVDVERAGNMHRFLSVCVYLSDNGGTEFFDGYAVGGNAGSVMIFPPLWMFPHSAIINGDGKYFLNTYLMYV